MASGNDLLSFGVGGAAVEKAQHLRLVHTDVLELSERGAGEGWKAGGATAGDGHDDVFADAGEAHGLRFTDPEPELVEARELEDADLAHLDAEESGDGLSGVEGPLTAAGDAHQFKTAKVGHAGTASEDKLSDFGVGGLELAEVLHRLVPHAGLVELAEVGGLEPIAGSKDHCDGESRKKDALRGAEHLFHCTGAERRRIWGVAGKTTGSRKRERREVKKSGSESVCV